MMSWIFAFLVFLPIGRGWVICYGAFKAADAFADLLASSVGDSGLSKDPTYVGELYNL